MNGQGSAFVLRDIPIFLWVFGLIFMGVGIMIIYESGSPKIFALILIALGLGTLLFSSVLTMAADRITSTLKRESRSVMRHKLIQVPFD
jgi:ABC-type transport system involved in multi-copper enzyme maturation permease subunit